MAYIPNTSPRLESRGSLKKIAFNQHDNQNNNEQDYEE